MNIALKGASPVPTRSALIISRGVYRNDAIMRIAPESAMKSPALIILYGFDISPKPRSPIRQARSMEYMMTTGMKKLTLKGVPLKSAENIMNGSSM